MTTVTNLRDHDTALLAVLANTGKPVGDNVAPDDGGWQGEPGSSKFVPYVVVAAQTARFEGPIADPYADARIPYSIISVGQSREQVRWMSDKVANALNTVTMRAQGITGRKVLAVTPGQRGAVERDDSTQPEWYYIADTYEVRTTPTT